MEDSVRFELTVGYKPTTVFKTVPLNHSGNYPSYPQGELNSCYQVENLGSWPLDDGGMEPQKGIEPLTYRLQGDCSTTELLRQLRYQANQAHTSGSFPKPSDQLRAISWELLHARFFTLPRQRAIYYITAFARPYRLINSYSVSDGIWTHDPLADNQVL